MFTYWVRRTIQSVAVWYGMIGGMVRGTVHDVLVGSRSSVLLLVAVLLLVFFL